MKNEAKLDEQWNHNSVGRTIRKPVLRLSEILPAYQTSYWLLLGDIHIKSHWDASFPMTPKYQFVQPNEFCQAEFKVFASEIVSAY